MTEGEYLALGETPERVELFDGRIEVSPLPTPLHQAVSFWIASQLNAPARTAGLRVYQDVNLRLRPGRIPGPDLVIGKGINPREPVVDASAVHLVGEIVSPSNAAADRVKKMHYYAEAGIPLVPDRGPAPGLGTTALPTGRRAFMCSTVRATPGSRY